MFKIKFSHLIGAIVRAKSCTDASVIDHLVKSSLSMHRRVHWTDIFAWRLFTMHARHWLERAPFFVFIQIDSQPMHFALLSYLVFSNKGNIVFALTGGNACLATNAFFKVNGHPILRLFFFFYGRFGIKAWGSFFPLFHLISFLNRVSLNFLSL